MKFEKGELLNYFRERRPSGILKAIFVDQNKSRARITITDRDGPRTISVLLTQLEKIRPEATQ